jgi:hypothetical protein
MATQDDLDWENTVSKNRQRETREKRAAAKEIKDRRKELLQRATSTSERRKIKAAADAALEQAGANFNKEYKPSENKQDYESDIQQRGTDQFTAPEATPEAPQTGGLPSGYVETAVIICVNGSPVSGKFLFKESTP